MAPGIEKIPKLLTTVLITDLIELQHKDDSLNIPGDEVTILEELKLLLESNSKPTPQPGSFRKDIPISKDSSKYRKVHTKGHSTQQEKET